MNSKWTKALMAFGFSLFLMISACDQGGQVEERGGGPGVAPEQRTDTPPPGPGMQPEVQPPRSGQEPLPGQEPRPGEPSGQREGFRTEEPKAGGTDRPEPPPQRPPAGGTERPETRPQPPAT
jgi:hypothetical protein